MAKAFAEMEIAGRIEKALSLSFLSPLRSGFDLFSDLRSIDRLNGRRSGVATSSLGIHSGASNYC